MFAFTLLVAASSFSNVTPVQAYSKDQLSFEAPKNSNPQLRLSPTKSLVLNDSAFFSLHSVVDVNNSSSSVESEFTENSDQINLYTVREGDTFTDIAKMYKVSVNTLLWANDLKVNSTLKQGQVLAILPVSGVKYTVKKGDTIKSIAIKLKAHTEDIIYFNGLDSENDTLAVGYELIVPDGKIIDPVKTNLVKNNDLTGKILSKPNQSGLLMGYFIRPVVGGVKTQGVHDHNAVDIAAKVGTPVVAAASGQVLLSRSGGWGGGYGNYIIIQHSNGLQTLYAHMSQLSVSQGQSVKQGEVIGQVGSTGRSTGPHLHIEIHGGSNKRAPLNQLY